MTKRRTLAINPTGTLAESIGRLTLYRQIRDASQAGASQAGAYYAQYREEQPVNVHAGTFTSGAWRTRNLNTVGIDANGIGSLSGAQVTLGPGTYLVRWSAPASRVDTHKTILWNVTANALLVSGTSDYAGNVDFTSTRSEGVGVFVLASASAIELRHRCLTTQALNGMGVRSNLTYVEVYAILELWKIA